MTPARVFRSVERREQARLRQEDVPAAGLYIGDEGLDVVDGVQGHLEKGGGKQSRVREFLMIVVQEFRGESVPGTPG